MKKIFASIFTLAMLSAANTAYAQCMPVLSSKRSFAEAVAFQTSLPADLEANVRQAPNGIYAVVLPEVPDNDGAALLIRLKDEGKIPSDAFCSSGNGYSANMIEAEPLDQSLGLNSLGSFAPRFDLIALFLAISAALAMVLIRVMPISRRATSLQVLKSPEANIYPIRIAALTVKAGDTFTQGRRLFGFQKGDGQAWNAHVQYVRAPRDGKVDSVPISDGQILWQRSPIINVISPEGRATSKIAWARLAGIGAVCLALGGAAAFAFSLQINDSIAAWRYAGLFSGTAIFLALLRRVNFAVWAGALGAAVLVSFVFFEHPAMAFSTPWERARLAEIAAQERRAALLAEQEAERARERAAAEERRKQGYSKVDALLADLDRRRGRFGGAVHNRCTHIIEPKNSGYEINMVLLKRIKHGAKQYDECIGSGVQEYGPAFVEDYNALVTQARRVGRDYAITIPEVRRPDITMNDAWHYAQQRFIVKRYVATQEFVQKHWDRAVEKERARLRRQKSQERQRLQILQQAIANQKAFDRQMNLNLMRGVTSVENWGNLGANPRNGLNADGFIVRNGVVVMPDVASSSTGSAAGNSSSSNSSGQGASAQKTYRYTGCLTDRDSLILGYAHCRDKEQRAVEGQNVVFLRPCLEDSDVCRGGMDTSGIQPGFDTSDLPEVGTYVAPAFEPDRLRSRN